MEQVGKRTSQDDEEARGCRGHLGGSAQPWGIEHDQRIDLRPRREFLHDEACFNDG